MPDPADLDVQDEFITKKSTSTKKAHVLLKKILEEKKLLETVTKEISSEVTQTENNTYGSATQTLQGSTETNSLAVQESKTRVKKDKLDPVNKSRRMKLDSWEEMITFIKNIIQEQYNR